MTPKVRVEPNWLDYANWYTNIVTNQRLGALIQMEQARQNQEAKEALLREIALSFERSMDTLDRFLPTTPAGVLFVVALLFRNMDNNEIKREAFRAFLDKDRIDAIRKRLENIGGQARARLDSREKDWVNQCIQWLGTLHFFDELEQHFNAVSAEARWRKHATTLHQANEPSRKKAIVATIGSGLAFFFTVIAMFVVLVGGFGAVTINPEWADPIPAFIAASFAFLISLAGVVLVVLLFSIAAYVTKGEEANALANMKIAQAKILGPDRLKFLFGQLGDVFQSAEQVRKVRDERINHLRRLTGSNHYTHEPLEESVLIALEEIG